MKTHRLIAIVALLSVAACFAADKPPAEVEHKYTPAGTRTDKVTRIAVGSDDDTGQLKNAKTIAGWIEQAHKARDPKNRKRAVGTLGTIAYDAVESNQPIPELATLNAGVAKCLTDSDAEVRGAALSCLDSSVTAEMVPVLSKCLRSDKDEFHRSYAAAILGKSKSPSAIAVLETAAKNKREEEHVRRAAIEAIAKLGGDQAKAALEGIAKSAPQELAGDVDKALDRVDGLGK